MSVLKIEKIVYFVRHGESEANIAPVFQAPDSPLTQRGIQQANLIAERISKLNFETLISSPFSRAKQTAEIIGKATNKTPEYSDLFVERIKPSSINGKSYEDNDAKRIWQEWGNALYTPGAKVEDGENFDEIMNRADNALDFLKNRPEKRFVVVTHGFFLRTLIARVLLNDSLTPENFKNFQSSAVMENSGLSAIKLGQGREGSHWYLWVYNDHAHLA